MSSLQHPLRPAAAEFIGPALVANDFGGLWIYLIAPLVGGAIAAVAYAFLGSDAQE